MTIDIHYSTKITHPSNKRVVVEKLATVTYIIVSRRAPNEEAKSITDIHQRALQLWLSGGEAI